MNILHVGVGKGLRLLGRYWSFLGNNRSYRYATVTGRYVPSPVVLPRDLGAWNVRVFYFGWPCCFAIGYSRFMPTPSTHSRFNYLLGQRIQLAFLRALDVNELPRCTTSRRWMPLLEVVDDYQVLSTLGERISRLDERNYELHREVRKLEKEIEKTGTQTK